jgi:ribonuclease HI
VELEDSFRRAIEIDDEDDERRGIEPPSPEMIERMRTARGGWTKAQLAEWGVAWPPPKGWRKELVARATASRGGSARLRNIRTDDTEPILLVHFDGACWPNPGGVLGWGVTIKRGRETLVELHDGRPASPSNTNNCAEYLALAAALEWLLEQGHAGARVHIRGDSRLVLRQMFPNGKGRTWRLKAGSYVEHARQAKALLERFSAVTGEWIAREGNRRADALSQQGVREVAG